MAPTRATPTFCLNYQHLHRTAEKVALAFLNRSTLKLDFRQKLITLSPKKLHFQEILTPREIVSQPISGNKALFLVSGPSLIG